MPTTNINVKLRPIRIGFLVRPGELSDLKVAAGLNSLLWGGLFNPVIPVATRDDAHAKKLLDLFQVDLIFPVEQSTAITEFVELYPFLRAPRLPSHELFQEDWRTKRNDVTHLDVISVIERLWFDEYQHKNEHFISNCLLPSWSDEDDLADVFSISYGYYPEQYNLKDDFKNAFLRGLRGSESRIEPDLPVPIGFATSVTPLSLTSVNLIGYRGSFTNRNGLYLGNNKSFEDLVNFWNLRASGASLTFVSLGHLDRMEVVTQDYLAHLDGVPSRHPDIEDHIAVFMSNPPPDWQAIVNRFATKKWKMICHCSDVIWNGMNVVPSQFCFGEDYALAFTDKSERADTVTISLPEKKFLADSERYIEMRNLAVSIEPFSSFTYSGHTLKPPYRPELNEFYSRRFMFDPWSVRSERKGIGVLITVGTKTVRLRPISNHSISEALVGLGGIKSELSQAGRLADRLVDKLGGLDGARIFKIRGVRNLVKAMNSQDAVTRGDATNAIWNDGQFEQHYNLYIDGRDLKSVTTHGVFDLLLKNDFFRGGIEPKCEDCRLENWLTLKQIDDIWICEFCGYANKTSLHIRDRGDWRFRKSGLLAKDNNQEGAIPVILALLTFQRLMDRGSGCLIASHHLADGKRTVEADFMVFHSNRDNEIECLLGEAKSEGGRIDDNDIDNLLAIDAQLREISIKPYLAFAKTADKFLPEELDLFRKLKASGKLPLLLTNKELEPYHPYLEGDDVEGLPHKYAMTFEEIARNSDFRYLGNPPDASKATV